VATDAIDTARALIDSRIRELEAEASRLRGALERLGGQSSSSHAAGRRDAHDSARESVRMRAARGEREAQLLQSLKDNPGYRVSEHAEHLGIASSQAHALLARLRSQGHVEKTQRGKYTVLEK
jgi:predicted Rossmann fold nucleotide-binding protein DprA/Smf involved in DNA uptake